MGLTSKKKNTLKKYQCVVCGWIYDPYREGELQIGIYLERNFEKLPENWRCPVCGAPKKLFVEYKS